MATPPDELEPVAKRKVQATRQEVDDYCAQYGLNPASRIDRLQATRKARAEKPRVLFDERTGSLSPLHQRIGEYGNSGNLDNDSDVDSVLGNEEDITFANIVPQIATGDFDVNGICDGNDSSSDSLFSDDEQESREATRSAADLAIRHRVLIATDRVPAGVQAGQPTRDEFNNMAPIKHVATFSTINTVNNNSIITLSDVGTSLLAPNGNGKNPVSLYMHYCRNRSVNGCDFVTKGADHLSQHHKKCDPNVDMSAKIPRVPKAAKPPKPSRPPGAFPCPRAGCEKTCTTSTNLTRHVRSHDWEVKVCPYDCNASKYYTSEYALHSHLKSAHPNDWSLVRCPALGCTSNRMWKNLAALEEHVKKKHLDVSDAERNKLIERCQGGVM